jgi:hypothetical protein
MPKDVVPIVESGRRPYRFDEPPIALQGCYSTGGAETTASIVVRQQKEVRDAIWHGDLVKTLVSKCCPDRYTKKHHGGQRRLNAFGKSEPLGRWGQNDSSAHRASEHSTRIIQIRREAAVQVQKGSLDGDKRSPFLQSGNHGGPEYHRSSAAEGCPGVETKGRR